MQSQKQKSAAVFSCRNISKRIGEKDILKNVSFSVSTGEKVGLVGRNGAGKTTLLKIIAGALDKDGGSLSVPKSTKISYVPQIRDAGGLSGGEAARKFFAPVMQSDADLFLLDEPTNDLDAEGLLMVRDFVVKSQKAFVIVSHDRRFLDETVTKIVEIGEDGKSIVYGGDYSFYDREKTRLIENQWKEYSDKIGRMSKFRSSIGERLSWMHELEDVRKNVKHLPIHEKEKPQAAQIRDREAKAGRRARILKDRLERYEAKSVEVKKPLEPLPMKIDFTARRGSTDVFTVIGAEKNLGGKKIGPVNMSIRYGDRVRIDGPNGSGKTTLLKMLTGEIIPDKGVVRRGADVSIGYIPQERWLKGRSEKKVIDEFTALTGLEETDARKILHRFNLRSGDVGKSILDISPGQYSRLIIAALVAQKPNCIILDEPTNHVDFDVIKELEDGLSRYQGTLIIVSHDRYFVDKLGLDKVFSLGLV